jgi:hypothetical protein
VENGHDVVVTKFIADNTKLVTGSPIIRLCTNLFDLKSHLADDDGQNPINNGDPVTVDGEHTKRRRRTTTTATDYELKLEGRHNGGIQRQS